MWIIVDPILDFLSAVLKASKGTLSVKFRLCFRAVDQVRVEK
jgi:hypothetical protein